MALVQSMRERRRVELIDDRAALLRIAAMSSSLVRERSQKIIPFSVAARSLSWLMQRVPTRVWADQQRRKELVHRAVCKKLLDCMLECRPPPSFLVSNLITFVYGDQTYKQRGSTRRAERLEYIGRDGLPLNIEREVVFNSVHLPVPAALLPQLDAQAVGMIQQHGVYCGAPFLSILPFLAANAVQQSLDAFMGSQLALINQLAQSEQKNLNMLSSAAIMDALVGRPAVDPGGPTYINILPTLRDTDTKAYADGYRMWEHWQRCLPHSLLWCVGGDGQLNLLWSYIKRKHLDRYKYVWIDVGDFHTFAHFLFAINELLWLVCFCCFAKELGRQNLKQRIPNLENNNYAHVLTFQQAVAVAIVVYFTRVVQAPPPALLYASPAAYCQQIHASGGLVLFRCLQYAGCPTLTWQRAIRSADGAPLPLQHAYAVHLHRAVHKTQEKRIMVIALLGYYCIHPALKLFKTAFCAISLLGRLGLCMAFDRLVEYINLRQSQRNSSFRAFDAALHYTPHLLPMMHVDAAYTAAVSGGESGGDAGYDPRMIREVTKLVEFFERKLGNDLTLPSAINPFFHTGNDVNLHNGAAREHRPWQWLWAVARGTAAGIGAAPQACALWLQEVLQGQMFPY